MFFPTKFIVGKDPHGTFPIINLVRIFIEKSEKSLQLQMNFSQSSDGLFMHSKFFLCLEMSQDYDTQFCRVIRENPKKLLPWK